MNYAAVAMDLVIMIRSICCRSGLAVILDITGFHNHLATGKGIRYQIFHLGAITPGHGFQLCGK